MFEGLNKQRAKDIQRGVDIQEREKISSSETASLNETNETIKSETNSEVNNFRFGSEIILQSEVNYPIRFGSTIILQSEVNYPIPSVGSKLPDPTCKNARVTKKRTRTMTGDGCSECVMSNGTM